MENFNKIKEAIAAAEADITKFEAGNASAGTRARGFLQEVKKLSQDLRNEIQEIKNAKKSS